MTGRLRIGIAAAVAVLLTATGMMRLLEPSTWLWPVVGAVVVSAASGELARRLVRPRPLVVAIQVLCVFWYATVVLVHEKALLGVIPTPASTGRLGSLLHQGGVDISGTVPGAAATHGIAAILVVSLGGLAVLVDALAATYGAAPLAGLPLLALYLVPATRTGGGYDWLAFTLTATGYTALLSAEGRERLSRWGRPLVHAGSRRSDSAPARPSRVDTGPIAATGHQITMIALAAAVIAPIFIPTVGSGLFGLGPDGGSGGDGTGSGSITLSLSVDLKASLNAKPVNVMKYYPDSHRGEYIRMQADDVFDPRAGFLPEGVSQPVVPDSSGTIAGTPLGLSVGPAPRQVTTRIEWAGFDVKMPSNGTQQKRAALPVPYPERSVSIGNMADWSYDPHTLALTGDAPLAPHTTYSVTSFDQEYPLTSLSRQQLDASPLLSKEQIDAGGFGPDTYVPGDLPPAIAAKAKEIIGGETSPFEQAVLLQDFFNDPKVFTYDTRVPTFDTQAEAMLNLLSSKRGFCQTFAATMTMMARTLNIPARVAVGFTDGEESGDGFLVTSHDLHAWPELYFDKIGWLRFEPTVGIQFHGTGHGNVPLYAQKKPSSTPSASSTASTAAGAGSSSSASSSCSAQQRKAGGCTDESGGGNVKVHQPFDYLGWFGAVPRFFDYWLFGGSVGAVILRFLLLAALLAGSVPMVARVLRRRRRSRIAGGRHGRDRAVTAEDDGLAWTDAAQEDEPERLRVLAAWAEIRDSATDLGYAWPSAETPRQSAERIIKQARLATPAQDAMDRMTGLAERANYARTMPLPTSTANLVDDVRAIRSGLAEPVSRRTRVRATVLPPSTMASIRERREDFTGHLYERVQHTGSRIRRGLARGRKGTRGGGGSGPGTAG